jgi:hypothetical protein
MPVAVCSMPTELRPTKEACKPLPVQQSRATHTMSVEQMEACRSAPDLVVRRM